MTPEDARHGTYAGAQAHIRERTINQCDPCHQALLRYRRRRRYDAAAGRTRIVPTGPVIAHLEQLRTQGVTMLDIATRAGVSPSLIDELFNRPRNTIRADNAAALLATRPPATPTGHIDSTGTIRRIQALGRLGWSMGDIVRRSHGAVTIWTLRRMSSEHPAEVETRTAQAVATVFDALCMTLPPTGRTASQVRAKAAAKGWKPPLAYDDIDDPGSRPTAGHDRAGSSANTLDHVVVQRILAGDWRTRATHAERCAVVAEWDGSHNELARLTGWRVERYLGEKEAS